MTAGDENPTTGDENPTTGDETMTGQDETTRDRDGSRVHGGSVRAFARTVLGRLTAAVEVDRRDRRWLALALLPSVVAVAVYLATNPYPAFGAGLYVQIAREIATNGYAPPVDVPGYTTEGVPFAYPPLQFYVLAAALETGVDPVTVARVLPGIAVVLVSVPAYLLGRDLAGSRPAGAAVATVLAVRPQVLQWHVSAGGVVRAFAFLYAITAVYFAYRAFTTEVRWPVGAGALAFGLTVLAHPTYTVFAVLSILVCYATESRTRAGFGRGLAIGLGGAVVASPWLAWAVWTHGPGVFAAAAGTHGGIGGGLSGFLATVSWFDAVSLSAGAYLVVRRRFFVPIWLVVAEAGFQQPRFVQAVGAFVIASALVDVAAVTPVRRVIAGTGTSARTVAVVGLLLTTAVGGSYLAHEMTLDSDPTTPEFLDDESVATMEWASEETDGDATFVVLGDAAEWFPALADRTIVVGPWGVEWRDADAFYAQIEAFETSSRCQTAACVEAAIASVGDRPDYVVVPKGQYTVRGRPAVQFGVLERSFEASTEWERAYENEGVVVYRAVGSEEPEQWRGEREEPREDADDGGSWPVARDGAGEDAEHADERESMVNESRRGVDEADERRVEDKRGRECARGEDARSNRRPVACEFRDGDGWTSDEDGVEDGGEQLR